jgi:hypothetical protein
METVSFWRRWEMEVIELRWAVQPEAYQWRPAATARRGESQSGAALCVSDFVGPRPPVRRYLPLQEQSGLFLIFAETPPTEDGILKFVNRFGMLLNATVTVTTPPPGGRKKAKRNETLAPHEEGYELWRTAILEMRNAVQLWQFLEQGDTESLARHIRWRKGEGKSQQAEYDSHPELPAGKHPPAPDRRTQEVITESSEYAGQLSQFRPGDVVSVVPLLLHRWLNRQLEGQLQTFVALDPDAGGLKMALTSANLLAGMWLQLAQAVCDHKQFRPCMVCGTPFEVSPETARTNRRFCSIACKNKSFRSRQEQAWQSFHQGKDVSQIAEELGATPTVIEGWINRRLETQVRGGQGDVQDSGGGNDG